jgi:hypothetical protein
MHQWRSVRLWRHTCSPYPGAQHWPTGAAATHNGLSVLSVAILAAFTDEATISCGENVRQGSRKDGFLCCACCGDRCL